LAVQCGVEIATEVSRQEEQSESTEKKEKFYQLNQWARNFFAERLQSEEGREARNYLADRGISLDMIETFSLGYAPDDWSRLSSYLRDRGADRDLACEVGLLKRADGSERVYDRFRHRLMFPIIEASGRLAGFGGRALRTDETAKYLNSPESEIFHKSKLLYGIDHARQAIRKADRAILAEGYLDVICMHQYGFINTIATLGTSCTADHIHQLKRHTKRVTLLFDGDNAGIKAAGRALAILLPAGMSVEIGLLPDSEDPDSFLRHHGRKAMEDFLSNALQPGLEFWIGYLKSSAQNDPVQLREATQQIIELLQPIEDHILQDLYLRRAAELLEVEEAQLRRGVLKVFRQPTAALNRPVYTPPISSNIDPIANCEHRAMAMFIKIAIEHPDMFSCVQQAEIIPLIKMPDLSRVWQQLIRDLQEGADSSALTDMVLTESENNYDLKQLLAQKLLKEPHFAEEDAAAQWQELLQTLQRLEIEREINRLQKEIKANNLLDNREQIEQLSLQKSKLQKQRLDWRARLQQGHRQSGDQLVFAEQTLPWRKENKQPSS
jgi:DNA primase catalytic core